MVIYHICTGAAVGPLCKFTMSSKQALVKKCIIVDGAPRYLNKNQLTDIIKKNVSTATILRHHFQDKHSLNQWILQLDSSECKFYFS